MQYLPKKAYKKLQDNPAAFLIDVRCEAENKFVGRPLNSILVPWLDEPDWEVDSQVFVSAIKRFIGESAPSTEIILICRSGFRSNDAGRCLMDNGYTNVLSGFEGDLDEQDQRGNVNGWRHDGMPWNQC